MVKEYGQFCGLARAASLLGERWALLVLRDLSIGPRRFTDLHHGLPGVPTSLLTTRLRELEEAGVVARTAHDSPGGGVLYRLTQHGEQLTPILDALGRWGAAGMSAPASEERITDASLAAALRAGFQPGALTHPASFVVQAGTATAWALAEPDYITVGTGEPDTPADLVVHSGPQLRGLLAGELTPEALLASEDLRIEGSPERLQDFARTFHVPLTASAR